MRRWGPLAALTAALATAAAASGEPAGPQRVAAGPTFTLVAPTAASCGSSAKPLGRACVDRAAITNWTINDGNARWDMPGQWLTTYQWMVPQTVTTAGAPLTMTLGAEERTGRPGNRICPAMGARSGFGFKGGLAQPVALGFCAEAVVKPTDQQSRSETLLAPASASTGSTLVITVGLQDGPSYTYTYKASNPTPKCKRFRTPAALDAVQSCLRTARFNFAGFHPGRILAPTGRRALDRWTLKGGNGVDMFRPVLSYYEGATKQDPSHTRGSIVDLEVTGAELRTSGSVKVAQLDVVVDSAVKKSIGIDFMLRCREGSRGSIVVVDDNRLLPGGESELGQTRDQVVVHLPACPYYSHTYSNADSLAHEPFVGGDHGGQRAYVAITTS